MIFLLNTPFVQQDGSSGYVCLEAFPPIPPTDYNTSIKPFWPLLFTFIIPKALGYFRALKTAYRTRPPPKALPPKVDRSLNILFCSILFFLVQSYPRGPLRDLQNVFATTNTRLGVPIEILSTRLSVLRPRGTLTAMDEALLNALTTKE